MLDVEYISEFYIVAARGIQDGKDYLDELYAEFDEEIPNERHNDARFRRAKNFLAKIDEMLPIAGTRYSNVADFYSLWAAVLRVLGSEGIEASIAAERLAAFQIEVEEGKTAEAQAYVLAARQGSNKAANRELRAKRLEQVLIGA